MHTTCSYSFSRRSFSNSNYFARKVSCNSNLEEAPVNIEDGLLLMDDASVMYVTALAESASYLVTQVGADSFSIIACSCFSLLSGAFSC